MLTSDDLATRIEIQDLLGRYTDAFFRKSEEDFRQCWTKDAEWIAFGRSTAGREAIVEFWRGLMEHRQNIWVAPHSLIVRASGSTANGRVYFNESVRSPDGRARIVLGIYHDEYAIEDAAWRFSRRWFNLIYIGPPDLSGRYWDAAPMGAPPEFENWTLPPKPSLEDVYAYVKTL